MNRAGHVYTQSNLNTCSRSHDTHMTQLLEGLLYPGYSHQEAALFTNGLEEPVPYPVTRKDMSTDTASSVSKKHVLWWSMEGAMIAK